LLLLLLLLSSDKSTSRSPRGLASVIIQIVLQQQSEFPLKSSVDSTTVEI